MKEMILCMLLLAVIIGAANFFELPARTGRRGTLSGLCASSAVGALER